jgi:hypothetical protein
LDDCSSVRLILFSESIFVTCWIIFHKFIMKLNSLCRWMTIAVHFFVMTISFKKLYYS